MVDDENAVIVGDEHASRVDDESTKVRLADDGTWPSWLTGHEVKVDDEDVRSRWLTRKRGSKVCETREVFIADVHEIILDDKHEGIVDDDAKKMSFVIWG